MLNIEHLAPKGVATRPTWFFKQSTHRRCSVRLKECAIHKRRDPLEIGRIGYVWRLSQGETKVMTRDLFTVRPDVREIRHFHLFCGLGGGAKGFNKANARVGKMVGKFRCLGGVDVDAAAIRDFERLTGTKGTMLDLFDRSQFKDFHDMEPPPGWREATPTDIQRAAGNERPHIVFLSAPCKGFSGLLSENRSRTAKYQALNRLTVRGVWLMLEAFSDDPPELIVFENVPRIANRGRYLLDQISELLGTYGYAIAETTHDCGELGEPAQSRKRFLLVARHKEKVPPFLYEPEKKRLQAVGTVLDRMPLPGDPSGGPMHRVPNLQWKTWVRLAFVEAGADWRSLNNLKVEDGYLRDFLIVPEYRDHFLGVMGWDEHSGTISGRSSPSNGCYSVADPREFSSAHNGILGVRNWNEPSGTVTGNGRPMTGAFSVADPRFAQSAGWHDGQAYGVRRWEDPTGAITGQKSPGQGTFAVADPRLEIKHNNCFRIVRFDQASGTVTAGTGPSAGGLAVADPRTGFGAGTHCNVLHVADWDGTAKTVTGSNHPSGGAMCVADPRCTTSFSGKGKYIVTAFDAPANTVIAGSTTGNGAFAVADPRPGFARQKGDSYLTAGHYGVVPWESPTGAVSAAAGHDNGRWNVADPRLPDGSDKLVCVIRALDGTWHRPFTTLEIAALQSLVDPEEQLELDGLSDSAWRERIGNAVPPDAAQAIAEVMGTTLLLAWSGETFVLSATPIWVRPVAIALSVAQGRIK